MHGQPCAGLNPESACGAEFCRKVEMPPAPPAAHRRYLDEAVAEEMARSRKGSVHVTAEHLEGAEVGARSVERQGAVVVHRDDGLGGNCEAA